MTENKIKPTMEQTIYCLKAESERYPEVCEECQLYGEVGCDHCYDDTNDMAIKFLKELEQYRAIGTVEHIQLTFELCKVLDAMTKMYEAIGTVEEFKALKEKNEEVEIPEPQGNEIVAGIMLPKVKGKAVVSLSDLHDILMDFGGINIRDKVFEQIYDRGVIIGLRDVIEKWEERRKNAEHEDCALSCEEIRNKAIDEFAERLKEKYGCLGYIDEIKFEEVDKIAEQLKAGDNNE